MIHVSFDLSVISVLYMVTKCFYFTLTKIEMLDKNSFNEREQAEIDALEARRRSIYKFFCFVL